MKKALSLAMLLMLTVLLPQAWAQQFGFVTPSGHTLYCYIDNGGAVIYSHDEINGALVIPDSVTYENASYPVVRIQD